MWLLGRVYPFSLVATVAELGDLKRFVEVFYDGVNVGNHEADLLVEGRVLVEVKDVQ